MRAIDDQVRVDQEEAFAVRRKGPEVGPIPGVRESLRMAAARRFHYAICGC